MKSIIILLLFSSISITSFGQNTIDSTIAFKRVLIIDTLKIPLDDSQSEKIKVEWLEKMELAKEEKYKTLYGNKAGALFIYIKKKYLRKAKRELGIRKN